MHGVHESDALPRVAPERSMIAVPGATLQYCKQPGERVGNRPRKKPSRRRTPPAQGERRAMVGYGAQYEIAASLILRHLRRHALEFVTLAAEGAGRVDDLVIGTARRVDAYQVKWAQYAGLFTFARLATPFGDSSISLIAQLADGWKRLREAHPSRRVVVHLATCDIPSPRDRVTAAAAGNSSPGSFAEFYDQAWSAVRAGGPVPPQWGSAWDALRQASGLADAEFARFVADCELDFGQKLPMKATAVTRDELLEKEQIRQIAEFLPSVIRDPRSNGHLDREALLRGLGWHRLLQLANPHEFPVDDRLYEPVEPTVAELEAVLATLPGGYVGLVGTPGSGKSTLLERTLGRAPANGRLVKYYAFLPNSPAPPNQRGESANFLHDVVLQLELMGFRPGRSVTTFDRDQLLQQFDQQLQMLGDDWERTGCRTLMLIDGLDHIPREQSPTYSLLRDLPPPDRIPNGVYMVLGSQTFDLPGLPPRVHYALSLPDRRVEMRPLDRWAVFRVIDRAGLSIPLSNEHRERIWELSAGHPLALALLINRLRDATDNTAVGASLLDAEPYRGDIEETYHTYWRQIEDDFDLRQLLGLLVRIRGEIAIDWVESWSLPAVTDRLRRRFGHYFRVLPRRRWQIFHNSFRLFLLRQTAMADGQSSESRHRSFHAELADRCASPASRGRRRWDELYHRVEAGQHAQAVGLATFEWFRDQFIGYRHSDDITADVRRAIASAAELGDLIVLSRLILISAEVDQRDHHLSRVGLASLLLGLGEVEASLDQLISGTALRGSAKDVAHLSMDFHAAGLTDDARDLFKAAEPEIPLSGVARSQTPAFDLDQPLLDAWAESAPRFRSVDEILRAIQELPAEAVGPLALHPSREQERRVKYRLLFSLCLGLLAAERVADLDRVEALLSPDQTGDLDLWFWLQIRRWQSDEAAGRHDSARHLLHRVLSRPDVARLGHDARATLASAVFRILGQREQAAELLGVAPQPRRRIEPAWGEDSMDPYYGLFSHYRLLRALGLDRPLESVIPDADETEHAGLVYLERAVVAVAYIWGDAWRGRTYSAGTTGYSLGNLLRLYHRSPATQRRWRLWHSIARTKKDFYRLLIDAVAQHGPLALQALCHTFEREWAGADAWRHWDAPVRRHLVLSLFRAGAPREWATAQLGFLEGKMLDGLSPGSRVEDCRLHAEAWLEVGDKGAAVTWAKRAMTMSLGISEEKDHQTERWIEWLPAVQSQDPQMAAAVIPWFARAVASLAHTSSGVVDKASTKLLAIAFAWSPGAAVGLLRWLMERHAVDFEDAVAAVLRAAIEHPRGRAETAFAVLVHFFLPLASRHPDGISTKLLSQLHARSGARATLDAARGLLEKLLVAGLPSIRTEWRKEIAAALASFGLGSVEVEPVADDLEPEADERSLRFRDGTILDGKELEARLSTPLGIRQVLENASEDSVYRCWPYIQRLAPVLGADGVSMLIQAVRAHGSDSFTLAILSQRLSALGERHRAWEIAEFALQESSGWSLGSHGGTRQAALRALIEADPVRGRRRALDVFVHDLTGQWGSPGGFASILLDVLPLVTADVPLREVWAVVHSYVRDLFSAVPLPELPEDVIRPSDRQVTPGAALCDLVASHLSDPVNALSQFSARTLAELLLIGDEDAAASLLRQLAGGGDDEQLAAVEVAEAVAVRDPAAVRRVALPVQRLRNSPNFAVAQIAKSVCGLLPEINDTEERPFRPLLAGYEFILGPLVESPTRGREIERGEPLPDGDYPLDLLRPFDKEVELVADAAGLSAAAVMYRAASLMRELQPFDTWSAAAERALRNMLTAADLRLHFRRPRAKIARRALCHVVAELVDAGRLDPSHYLVEHITRFSDPHLMLTEPAPRPPEVREVRDRDPHGDDNAGWLASTRVAVPDVLSTHFGDGIVLGESTRLTILEPHEPEERRLSGIRLAGESAPIETVRPHATVIQEVSRRYQQLHVLGKQPLFVVKNQPYALDTDGADWIALDPRLGQTLGWKLAAGGLFRWLDGDGRKMVESIWWRAGSEAAERHHTGDVEVGDGWLVVASRDAWEQLCRKFGPLDRVVRIERQYHRDGECLRHEASATVPAFRPAS